jgi:hypothetical protein
MFKKPENRRKQYHTGAHPSYLISEQRGLGDDLMVHTDELD